MDAAKTGFLLAKRPVCAHVSRNAMKEIQVIETALSQAATRRRWDRALRGFWHGLLAGSIVWLLGLLLYKLLPIPLTSLAIAGTTGALLPVAGWIIGGWRRPTLL